MKTTTVERGKDAGPVSMISLPPDARALSTVSRVDYEDAFLVDVGVDRTAEQWLRAVINDPPFAVRARLVTGWLTLGLKLGLPWSGRRVLGWKVLHSDASYVLLGAESWLGLRGQLLFRSETGGALLFATIVQLSNPAARAVWATITPTHQDVVHSLLSHAAGREACR